MRWLTSGLSSLGTTTVRSSADTTRCPLAERWILSGLADSRARPALVNLDDCWATGRDKDGKLIADPKLWTGGTLKHIADYAHSKGMKFGTYTDRGTQTCAKRPGAQGHEALDAATYASWGVE